MSNYIDLPIYRRSKVVTYAKVSKRDFERISKFRWYLDSQGYARRVWCVDGKQHSIRLHQEILKSGSRTVDHKNRNKLDCRRENLRFASKSLNAHNTERKGVYFNKWQNRFYAHCRVNGIRHSLGGYRTRKEAESAVVNFRTEMGLV